MSRLYILCEGQTEEKFVNVMMHGWFAERGIEHQQIILKTRPEKNRGGVISYAQVKRDILRLCNEHRSEYVTTLIDYSPVLNTGLDYDVSGTDSDTARRLESAVEADIKRPNLMMNFVVHELEATYFSDPNAFSQFGPKAVEGIEKIMDKYGTPENINTDVNKLPSKQIDRIIHGYRESKIINSKIIFERLELEKIIETCPHFRYWTERIDKVCCGDGPQHNVR